MSFESWVANAQSEFEAALSLLLPEADPKILHEAMRYAALNGGKRIRPLLVLATGEMFGAPKARLLRVAAALEMIHVYSLVHDDLPCMDDDAMRRGKPTCHVAYDEATALLVGDALQSRAFEVLSEENLHNDAKAQIALIQTLAKAAGAEGMAGGQAIDLASIGKPLSREALETMHLLKTGALIRAAVLMGALSAEEITEDRLQTLDLFARRAGLLFQVIDDILDATQSSEQLGKTAGKDAQHHKPTFVSLMGLAGAQTFASALEKDALSALVALGKDTSRLTPLLSFIAKRTF